MATTLRTARKRAGLSSIQVAFAVGVNRSTIWRLETGLRLPMHETAQRLEKLLGCTLAFKRVNA
jgi:transcriptional regulator with XRE-family HTH domain